MSEPTERADGFYWIVDIRSTTAVQVAQYYADKKCWYISGWECAIEDSEVRVVSERIPEPPE